MAFIDGHVDAL
ncbi:hypothetical protein LI172_09020 [Coprococcus catus]|nr:hypothetical protein [Coprococcus catus]